jgi:hypothetical protein
MLQRLALAGKQIARQQRIAGLALEITGGIARQAAFFEKFPFTNTSGDRRGEKQFTVLKKRKFAGNCVPAAPTSVKTSNSED